MVADSITITAIAVVVVVVVAVVVVAAPVVVAAVATAAGVAATTVAADGAVVAGAAATSAVVGAVAETEADNVLATAAETSAETTSTATEAVTADTAGDTSASTSSRGSWSVRVQQLRTLNQVGKSRNIAIMDYNIEGESDSIWASSGPDFNGSIPKPTDSYFDATPTGNNLRNADSEYKLLNWLAQRFNPAGTPQSYVSGTVDLYTERPPCLSCLNVINLYRRMFPWIELNVFDGP